MWRALASNALTLFIILLIVIGGLIGWGQNQYHAAGPLAEPFCLRVVPGARMDDLSSELAEQGAIQRPWLMRAGARYSGKSSGMRYGSYLVPAGASLHEIVEIVTRGGQSTCGVEIIHRIGVNRIETQVRELDPSTGRYVSLAEFAPQSDATEVPEALVEARSHRDTRIRIVLAEGVTSWQVVNGLNAFDILTGKVSAVPPEGWLAPDSYEVSIGDDRGELLVSMEARQLERVEREWRNRIAGLPIDSPDEALILASIVEKETGVPDERGIVAGVFVNRLREGMPLQTDPSVIYGITNGQGGLDRGLRRSELRTDTPYNTYLVRGLPPTPISNPGLASIRAALNPDETDYLYFVADGTGGHAFAVTLKEHNANVAKWRALESPTKQSVTMTSGLRPGPSQVYCNAAPCPNLYSHRNRNGGNRGLRMRE